jgi:hypothetical protein
MSTTEIRSLRRTSRTLFVLWFVGGFAFGLLTVYVNRFFVILLVALLAVVGISMMRLRCKTCGHPIHMHYIRIFRRAFPYWAPWISDRCDQCSAEIP